jgi:hypothetical protein
MDSQPVNADGLGAEWLDGFIPTQRGIRVRGGITKAAQLDGAVKSLFSYVVPSASAFFAATASAIYNITSANPDNVSATIADGFTAGDWSVQQIGTSGGDYLLATNGADYTQIYDGTSWQPIAAEAISDLDYDALTADFAVGETLTGGTSGATATILGMVKTDATTGTLKIGTVTGGPFQDNETITSAGGSATADGTVSAASALTITGQATNTLSHVWLFRNRLFFVEKDSLTAHYLPAGSVGGALNDVSLAGVFRRGGSLLFGATWAIDSGDGLDDKCVFVSTEGEVAIYAGTDPSNASTWGLEGRYDIGKPIGKTGTITAGGDLLIATVEGVVPVSAAINRDPSVLDLAAVTSQIRETWRLQVDEVFSGVQLIKWVDEALMLAVFPGSERLYTANLVTGAWATQSGWCGDCAGLFDGNGYVGRSDNYVYQIDSGGTDDGAAFSASACFAFGDYGAPVGYKRASMMRAAFFAGAGTQFAYQLSIAKDYRVNFPAAPSAVADGSDVLVWGTGTWGGNSWADDATFAREGRVDNWRAVSGTGQALAPMVQIASGAASRLNVELISIDLILANGGRAA